MANVSPYSRTRNRQLIRVLRLIKLLSEDWHTLATLTRELSVTDRTIRRDLTALEYAHLPVRKWQCDDGKARWTMRRLF